jgi:hypothetical protein
MGPPGIQKAGGPHRPLPIARFAGSVRQDLDRAEPQSIPIHPKIFSVASGRRFHASPQGRQAPHERGQRLDLIGGQCLHKMPRLVLRDGAVWGQIGYSASSQSFWGAKEEAELLGTNY